MTNIASGYFGKGKYYYYPGLVFIVISVISVFMFVYLYRHTTLTSFLIFVASFIFGAFMLIYLFFYSKSNFAYNLKVLIVNFTSY